MRRYGTIPWMMRAGRLRIVLVQSKDGDRWVLPKGRAKKGMSKRALAALEAWEEAGIRGEFFGGAPVDVTVDRSKGRVKLRLYPMHVSSLKKRYPERDARLRRVVSPKRALALLTDPGMRRAVQKLATRLI